MKSIPNAKEIPKARKVRKVVADPKFFPRFFRSEKWLKGPFVPPEDKKKRRALYKKLEYWSHYGILNMPGYEELLRVLLERLELLDPTQKRWSYVASSYVAPGHVSSKESLAGNFLLRSNDEIRAEDRDFLAKCVDAINLRGPQHAETRRELKARLAAIDAYNHERAKK